jgi:hypothetical protein
MTELLPMMVIFLVIEGKPLGLSSLLLTAVSVYVPPPKQIVDGVLALFALTIALIKDDVLEATTVCVQATEVAVGVGEGGMGVGVKVAVGGMGVSVGVAVSVTKGIKPVITGTGST